MKFDAIFIIGPAGSGKGTQGKRLATFGSFFYWEMGAILREIAAEDSEYGRSIATVINAGELLNDTEIETVLQHRLTAVPQKTSIIFDGVPRRIEQAQYLIKLLRRQGKKNFLTIFLHVPREVSIERLLLRAKEEGRIDDVPEKIARRLDLYTLETLPVIQYLMDETIFLDIDGLGSRDEITQEIIEAMEHAEVAPYSIAGDH